MHQGKNRVTIIHHSSGQDGSSSRSSQTSNNTYSFMSTTDTLSEVMIGTNPDMLTDAEIEARFEKMLAS